MPCGEVLAAVDHKAMLIHVKSASGACLAFHLRLKIASRGGQHLGRAATAEQDLLPCCESVQERVEALR